MSALSVDVSITGLAETAEAVQRLRTVLARRGPLHAHLAAYGARHTQDHVRGLEQHTTANRLGASPTNHLQKTALRIEGQSDDQAARVLLPRASRLRAAFGSYTATPGPGKKYLTIPAHRSTYGKRAGEIQADMAFSMVGGRHKALVFTDGPDVGTVAYWLRSSVEIDEDKTLIPFDVLLDDLADEAVDWIDEAVNGTEDLV